MGKIDLAISFMSETENNANPFVERKLFIASFFDYASATIGPTLEN